MLYYILIGVRLDTGGPGALGLKRVRKDLSSWKGSRGARGLPFVWATQGATKVGSQTRGPSLAVLIRRVISCIIEAIGAWGGGAKASQEGLLGTIKGSWALSRVIGLPWLPLPWL